MRLKFLFILLMFSLNIVAQVKIDSLWAIWEDEFQEDNKRVTAITDIANGYLDTKPDSAFYYAQIGFDYARKKGLKKQMAELLNTQGHSHRYRGEYSKASECYHLSLDISGVIKDRKGTAGALNNIGYMHYFQNNYDTAYNYYSRSMSIYEEIEGMVQIAYTLRRIGQIFFIQDKYEETLVYWERALNTSQENEDLNGLAQSLNNIGFLYFKQSDYANAAIYYERSLSIRTQLGNRNGVAASLANIGNIHLNQGNYLKSIYYHQRSLRIKEEIGDEYGIAESLLEIGNIYLRQNEYTNALDYYNRCLEIYEKIGIKLGVASSLHNMGIIFQNQDIEENALEYYNRSLEIYREIGNKDGIAANLSTIGSVYLAQRNYTLAMNFYQKSFNLREEMGDKKGISGVLNSIGLIYFNQQKYTLAIVQFKRAITLAREIGALEQQRFSNKNLYNSYKVLGNNGLALEYHEQMLAITDSLKSEETAKNLQQMEFDKQLLKDSIAKVDEERKVQIEHQAEIHKKEKIRNISFLTGGLILLLTGGLYSRLRFVRKSKANLQVEKDRSEKLLLNILPEEIAQELKEKGKANARDFEMISILFTDFKGFTQASAKLSAQDLVAEINTCFEAFDGIIGKYGIEKIKTIGDAYMAAGGLPVPTDDSLKKTVLAALEMQEFILKRKAERDITGEPAFEMRCGIHTGPVVAGIVGVKKFQYDVWGDTVNTASRIESSGEVGKVNLSQDTYKLIKDDNNFIFEKRGKIEAKGKGKIEMWFVRNNSQ